MDKNRNTIPWLFVKYAFILMGSIMTAAGLEIFFKAHNLIAGGVIGAAVILSYLTEIPLSVAAILLNFPFLLIGYRQRGKSVLFPALFAMTGLVYWMTVFSPALMEPGDIIQSTVLGGILMGVGSGLILRYGGYVDGVEQQRVYFKTRLQGEIKSIFLLVNLATVCAAGFVFGWEPAIYSIGAYFIVFKVSDITIEMFGKTRQLVIISDKADEVAEFVYKHLGKAPWKSARDAGNKTELTFNASNYELAHLKSVIHDIDHDAEIYFENNAVKADRNP
jgi:uncharacterized membrane-anchored protein YitT (DUF2179 family)